MKKYISVAPHVGAWIETILIQGERTARRSLPMWERGLKPGYNGSVSLHTTSLPMWERGLKHRQQIRALFQRCRSPCGSVD